MSEDSGSSELRLLLLGNIGCGKTSSADTILSVVSPVSPSASRKSQLRRGAAEGRGLTLVEAPRWYWNGGKMEDSVRTETQRAATLVSPGPHAVLLLVPVSQFTEMEARVPAELEEAFGSEVLDHTLVLLTCGDYLMGRTVEEYLRKEHPGLRQIIERCGGRYHVINNRQRQDRDQVQQLLEKVDSLVAMNGVYYMKSSEERDLERRVSDRKKELMENYRAQKEKRETSSSSSPETLRSIDYGTSSSTSERRRSNDYSTSSSSTSYTTPETRRSIDYTSTSFTPETRRSVDYSSSSTTSSNPETRRSIDYSSSSTSNSSTTPDLRRINDYSSTSSSSPSYTMDTRRSNDYSTSSPTSETRRSIDYSNTSSSSTSYSMDTRRNIDYSTSSPTPETRRSIDYSSTSFTNPETRRINDYSTSSSTSYTTPETRSSIDYSSTSSPTLETRRSITSFTPETRSSIDYSSSSTNPDLRRINDYSSTSSSNSETRRITDYSTTSSSTSYTTPATRRSNDYSSTSFTPETRRITDYSTSSSTVETRRRSWREEAEEESVGGGQTSNGLHSAQSEPTRSPSFRLNADGALLSQMSEVRSTPRVVSTFHQRMNSVEDKSPGMSPPSTPHSPVFFSSSSPSSSSPELRLVLLGRSGSGKSAVGNQILGREAFESHQDSLTAVTQECEKKKAFVEGRQVAVVDTPDWFNSERTPDEVRAQISSCVALSSPGPHAFLMCVPLDQPAKTELQGLGALESVFGPDSVQRRTLLIFTFADKLKQSGKTGDGGVESYIAAQRPDLLKLVEKCGDRFHVMETGGGAGGGAGAGGGGGVMNRRNVSDLLEKVEQTVKEGGGNFYSHPAFQEAEDRVRQRQVEIARDRKIGNSQHLYSYMQPVEEVNEDELERTRDEAELSVRSMNIESLPPITRSTMNPSMLQSLMEKMEISAKMFPKFLSDSSVWVGEGAKKVKDSPVWGKMGSGAQNVHKMVVDSSVWGKVGSGAKVVGDKVGTGAGHVSKLVGPRVPKVVVDGSAWVGSGAKSVAASPVWGKVGSGAKTGASLVADGSMRLGAGAKTLAQSPVWGKVGSGAKSGAKLMAENSVKVGAGIGAGAKKVAQSPVWGKMGSGAKAGAKKVAESPVWEKIGTAVKKIPKVVIGGALLGLVLGVVLGGALGGAIGATVGSAVSEVGRRKLGNKTASEKTENAVRTAERNVNDGIDSVRRQGEKLLKTE